MTRWTSPLAVSMGLALVAGCVGTTDEPQTPCTPTAWYSDADGDGFGSPFDPVLQCEAPDGTVADATDCDDADPMQRPGAVWYLDEDGDGHGNADAVLEGCQWPLGYVAVDTDCDDTDPTRNPDREWFVDADLDGAGDPANTVPSCGDLTGAAVAGDDCDDADPALFPGALEICDGIDNNCDELVDDADPNVDRFTQMTLFADVDGDGWGTEEIVGRGCANSELGAVRTGDCDDSDSEKYPSKIDYVGGIDTNCDGESDWHDASFAANAWTGVRRNTQFGRSAVLGDTDGDGQPELIVSEPRYNSGRGGVWVLPNEPLNGVQRIDADASFWTGENGNDEAGYHTAVHPDLDDDGIADIIIAAPAWEGRRGRLYVVPANAPSGPIINVASTVISSTYGGAELGRSILVTSDAVLVGVPLDDTDFANAGRVYRLGGDAMGGDAELVDQPHLSAWGGNNRLGYGMAAVGDTDGDGRAEIAIGAYNFNGNTGRVVLLPADEIGTTVVTVEDADRLWQGSERTQFVGQVLAGAGDVDGDGLDDLIIGSGNLDTTEVDAGGVWLVRGSSDAAFDRTVDEAYWTITGDSYREFFGRYVSGPGDIDGDGKDDVLVGAINNADKGDTTGAIYGFMSDRGAGTWSLADDDPDLLFVGEGQGDQVGWLMLPAGDVNADGYADVWVGGPRGAGDFGALYMLFGGARE